MPDLILVFTSHTRARLLQACFGLITCNTRIDFVGSVGAIRCCSGIKKITDAKYLYVIKPSKILYRDSCPRQ